MTIKDIIKEKNYEYVEFRIVIDDISIFAGSFTVDNGEIISLDGDTYDENEVIVSYEEFDNGTKLTVYV